MIETIRKCLLKTGTERHTEEFVLRELFREHDRDSNGVLSINEIRTMLNKLNISAEDKYITGLMKEFDSNNNGVIEFEEFVALLV